MDFSLFPTVLSKKEPNIAQEKSESAEMWKIQLIWGFWWHYKSGGGLYKFGGGSRMAVTSNCVNEKKFFQLEPGEETRNIPILIDTYQCIAWWRLWKQSKKNFTVFWVLYTQLYTVIYIFWVEVYHGGKDRIKITFPLLSIWNWIILGSFSPAECTSFRFLKRIVRKFQREGIKEILANSDSGNFFIGHIQSSLN